MAVAVALGLALLGWVCVVAALLPSIAARPGAQPWVGWVLGAFAVVFFLIGAGFAFGLIRA